MTSEQTARVDCLAQRLFAERWSGSVADWVEANIRFDEPKISGPFSFAGREYLREPLEAWSAESITDMVIAWGAQTGKTRIAFCGLGWRIRFSPTRVLWVMPNSCGPNGAQSVSRTRFQPMIRATPSLSELIPGGARRHDFKSLQMILNGSVIDITGSNSDSNLSGNPCDCVLQDEVDKFKRRGESEAHPSHLADVRTKTFSTPKRVKTSTPTLISGLIWQELMKSDVRRREMPCPHCGKFVIFSWSKQFEVLPLTGREAFCVWDRAAKRKNGTWDLDRVVNSARAECPFCGGHIRDSDKMAMDKAGQWVASKPGAPGYAGWHLPSMYAINAETTFGQLAKQFLLAHGSILGVQNFCNSELALPYIMQDTVKERVELVSKAETADPGWVYLLTVDCQRKGPNYFWCVVRRWKDGASVGVAAQSCHTWEDVEELQKKFGVRNEAVMVDSGFGSKSDAEVYRRCAEHCEALPRQDKLPSLLGWMPSKGFGTDRKWLDRDTNLYLAHRLQPQDPYDGTTDAGKFELPLFEYAAGFYEDILENLRAGKDGQWSVAEEVATEEYWRHLDGHVWKERVLYGQIVRQRAKRHRDWPDHMLDCEIGQVAFAVYLGLLDLNSKKSEPAEVPA